MRLQHPLGRPASRPDVGRELDVPGLEYIYAQCGGGCHTPDIPVKQSNVVEMIRMVDAGTEEEEVAMFGRRSALRTPTANCT